MATSSFDIVSKVDRQEVDNALNQAAKELSTRFDFRGTDTTIEWQGEEGIILVSSTEERVKVADVQTLAPFIPRSKVVAFGRNYAEHANELGNEAAEVPMMFLKPNTSVIGPGDAIVLPPQSERVDFEGEVAAVIAFFAAPAVAFFAIRSAADANDMAGLARLIDYGAVRQSLRAQIGEVRSA